MAYTALPAAGAKLRAATFSDIIKEVRSLTAIATSDQNLATANTTLQNATQLVVPLLSGGVRTYIVDLTLTVLGSSGAAEDIKLGVAYSGTCTLIGSLGATAAGLSGSTATDVNEAVGGLSSGVSFGAYGVTTTRTSIWLKFLLIQAAGTFQVMAAQNTSGGNVIAVGSGSVLEARVVD